MTDIGTLDFDDPEEGIKNDSTLEYFSYHHPVWIEMDRQEKAKAKVNTTYSTVPDMYELNRRKAASFYPIFIVFGCVMMLGVLCNILVCYIYRCRPRRATSNFFVIFFAIFDIIGCLVGIPLIVLAFAIPYTYTVAPLCKIMGFIETILVSGQCLTLICVAYDCYKKLCRPNDDFNSKKAHAEDFNVKKARLWCVILVIVAVLVSIPALVVFDIRNIKTSYSGVFGKTCSIDPEKPQWLRIMYNAFVLGSFTVSLSAMSVFYCLIGISWLKQRQAEERGEKPSPAKKDFPKKHRFVREETSSSSVVNYSEESSRLHSQGNLSYSNASRSDPARVPLKSSSSGLVKTNSLQASSTSPSVTVVQLHVTNTRQASIFMVISIVFVVLMLPYVVVMVLCATTTVFNHFSSNVTEIVFNLCIRSYLFNYLVKPVTYFIFNMNFRKKVKEFFNKMLPFCNGSCASSDQPSSLPLRRSLTMGTTRSTSRTPIYKNSRSST